MRVTKIDIAHWRNFRNITMSIPVKTPFVCLVGENGTGKSSILELISATAGMIGLAANSVTVRTFPLDELHEISVTFFVNENKEVFKRETDVVGVERSYFEWNNEITIKSSYEGGEASEQHYIAGGISDGRNASDFAQHVITKLRGQMEVQSLFLDPYRSFAPVRIETRDYEDSLMTSWESPEINRRATGVPARTLYDQWIQSVLAREAKANARHMQLVRQAQAMNQPMPEFQDSFGDYRAALLRILPHLRYVRVDSEPRQIIFSAAGLEVSLDSLSSGEREIAFIVGQIKRFGLRQGLFLLDEPERHLNSDLLRVWLEYLRDSVDQGQTWIATHAIESAEVTGRSSTYVLARNSETNLVDSIESLEARPVFATLASSVGAPAFSLSRRRFVFIEGTALANERARFRRICGDDERTTFLPAGSCRNVLATVANIQDLVSESDEQIRVAGIIDADFRSKVELIDIASGPGIHVLQCHEIENLFIHPAAIDELLRRNGRPDTDAAQTIRDAADVLAGKWILSSASAKAHRDKCDPDRKARDRSFASTWFDVSSDPLKWCRQVASDAFADSAKAERFDQELLDSFREYEALRTSDDLWAFCLGKESMHFIARALGFTGAPTLEQQVCKMWSDHVITRPEPARQMIEFVNSIVVLG